MTFSLRTVLTLLNPAWGLGSKHFPQSYSQLLWINNLSPAQFQSRTTKKTLLNTYF